MILNRTNKYKKTLVAIVLASSLASTPSHAFLLCNDFPALAENMYGHIQDAMSWASQKAMSVMDMDMEALFNQLTMDQKDKIAAFGAFNAGRIEQEVQNKQIKKEMAGNAKEACSAISTSKGLNDSMCASVNQQKVALAKGILKSVDRATTSKEFQAAQLRNIDSMQNKCLGSGKISAWTGVAEAMSASECQRSDLITGTPGTVLNKKQVTSAKDSISLIVHNVPVDAQDYSMSPDSKQNKETRLKGLRRAAIKNLVTKSLTEVLRFSEPDSAGVTPLGAMDKFNKDRYADPKGCWATKWSGKEKAGCEVRSFTENVKMPSQVVKEQLVIEGFMSNLAVYQFKQQLRVEALQAAQLALEAEPL